MVVDSVDKLTEKNSLSVSEGVQNSFAGLKMKKPVDPDFPNEENGGAIEDSDGKKYIKQAEYSIPLVNSSIPDFGFIDEWLKETDSMDTEVSLNNNETDNCRKPTEVKTERTELLGSIEIPLVQESCKESIGVDSSIEIALQKVSLVGTFESSGIVDIKSDVVVNSHREEKNLMVSEGGGNGISLVDDPMKSHNDEGDKESSEIVKDSNDGWLKKTDCMDTDVSLNNIGTVNGGKPTEVKTEQTELLGSIEIPLVQESCKESIGVDSSIGIALDKVSLVGTFKSSDIVDIKSGKVVTSHSEEKNLMVSGGGSGISLADDPMKSHNDEGDKESSEIVKDSSDGDDSSESESKDDDDDEDDDESADESSSSSESSDEEGFEEAEKMGEVEEGEIKELEELIGESDGDEEGFLVKGPIKSKNEVQDLPPVPKVDVTLELHHQTLPVGVVLSIMDAKVIVEGVEKHNPLNEGSILWITENRSVLGVVDEIFGPVKNPYYVVRYNSKEEVPTGISQGTLISFVVEFADHVLNDKNIYKKGYDASGENDEELTDEAEFSDDEKEAEYKRMQRMSKRGPSDDMKHGKRDFVDKKKFQQKPKNVNNNQTLFAPSNVPPHQVHGGCGSSPSPFRSSFVPPTSQVPQAHSAPVPQQHPLHPNRASQQHPLPYNMGPPPQQHPLPPFMGPPPQQPSNMGSPHPLPSFMGPPPQQHPQPSFMGPPPQQHPLPSNMVWPNGQPYQNVSFLNGFPMNAMPYAPYQQPQHFCQPQMFTGFSSGPLVPQHFNPSQRPVLGPLDIPPEMPPPMPAFMGHPVFNQGPILMGFQGYPPRPHMNPGEQGVLSQGSINETHINMAEQGVHSQGQGPLNEQNNGVQPPSTQGNFSSRNQFNSRGAARGGRPYRRGSGRGRH